MSGDPETLAVYQARAADYAAMLPLGAPDADLQAFIARLPAGAAVLDLGCGPGAASASMLAAGLEVDPVDATPAMVELARACTGNRARLATFDDLTAQAAYAGIWANFSLLHAPRADLPRYLEAIHRALSEGGVFHIGMKLGAGEERDDLGRFYSYYSRDELAALLASAGFEILSEEIRTEAGLSGKLAAGITILTRALPQ
ncbi:class I SAM-dependent DNA methyltransferase [Pararhodobacter oceanensis]|uniref:class I SAM-dependent DNA methyltransferase n=1 Tax=Pararhodobacter oceanensis TaxID=2172121 RepID=UPI003A93D386